MIGIWNKTQVKIIDKDAQRYCQYLFKYSRVFFQFFCFFCENFEIFARLWFFSENFGENMYFFVIFGG